jgi:hypothetical protein
LLAFGQFDGLDDIVQLFTAAEFLLHSGQLSARDQMDVFASAFTAFFGGRRAGRGGARGGR